MRCKLREGLQKGYYRTWSSIFLAALSFLTILLLDSYFKVDEITPSNSSADNIYHKSLSLVLKSSAPIALLLSALAYNLRSKVFDFIVKKIDTSSNKYEISRKSTQDTLHNLTNLVLISFGTSVLSLIAGHQPLNSKFLLFFLCIGIAALTFCCVQYIYALFAFEYLESIIIKVALSSKYPDNDE